MSIDHRRYPVLFIVIPCFNEEEVLPVTAPLFMACLNSMVNSGKISPRSKVLFINDGSSDATWSIIRHLSDDYAEIEGISLSRNRGHQNALLAGLEEASHYCDASISIDCDGQDDIATMEDMVDAYLNGSDVVYGVRSSRKADTLFKRTSAQAFYKLLDTMGVETIYNHADYRLLSCRVMKELMRFKEVNLYLRGMVPLVGFNSTCVYYERHERAAGGTHYPIRKMLALAIDGITSFSIKPIRGIAILGIVISILSFIGVIWAVATVMLGNVVAGWASIVCIICFMSGIQLISLGVIGEYVGKAYLEAKRRPRYSIKESTFSENDFTESKK
ncbi:glycosyltransferase family 2 protein [Enorma phocaeensis]|uniref:Glycosyltransferase family 2 protein n=1 Tax=Enorma phocaeensis TaxID=1871019 RepID=A0ABT7VBE4_9ACTN|nr:glycosyltransferase family 2 protein [Enorma phocaeensis]MDM8275820.1 glycosyltransferase family 2 protein [Enorma phocaeensis]